MRMWNIDPRLLCRKHLLGEHVETHMFLSSLFKGRKLDGFIHNGLFEPSALRERHDELAEEMLKRNYNHMSEFDIKKWYWSLFNSDYFSLRYIKKNFGKYKGFVDSGKNLDVLRERCKECRELIG